MSGQRGTLTSTAILATATDYLGKAGYSAIHESIPEWETTTARLFENEYNVVGVVVFDTCTDLTRSWPDLQGSLVGVMSRFIGRAESKAWDGYLVLLTPSLSSPTLGAIDALRYDTSRVRKLVATGEVLRFPADVHRILSPLVSLPPPKLQRARLSALDALAPLLATQGVAEKTTEVIVHAFRSHEPLLEALHRHLEEK